ncbi:MAG: biopolymer transporter ExbD [Bacteroidales bacterium]|jgi:biopolymer transport protein ExbD|nr:biopolymer transporter ExbD [Bacteroidales bacterium]MCK9499430.1 biopolymer transporter ExbD [Bacteroidales bacterium]MDY0313922.1 biopolymer transporter ExbD [Bacteroidales bacterium]NLB86804.1 biopolymer transporter ExbD [Bacteroidales bacterium]
MAIKSRSKVSAEFSMSSMSDLVFLLLIFFMITSTMIAPNALKLLLPSSNSQTQAKPFTTVSIKDMNDGTYVFAVGTQPCDEADVEQLLIRELVGQEEPYVSLHVDKSVPMEQVVKIMNISKNNNWKLILATKPE